MEIAGAKVEPEAAGDLVRERIARAMDRHLRLARRPAGEIAERRIVERGVGDIRERRCFPLRCGIIDPSRTAAADMDQRDRGIDRRFIDARRDVSSGDDAARFGRLAAIGDIFGRQLHRPRRGDRTEPQAGEHQFPPFDLARQQDQHRVAAADPRRLQDSGRPRAMVRQFGEAAIDHRPLPVGPQDGAIVRPLARQPPDRIAHEIIVRGRVPVEGFAHPPRATLITDNWVYSAKPSSDCSTPRPDDLTPAIGICGPIAIC